MEGGGGRGTSASLEPWFSRPAWLHRARTRLIFYLQDPHLSCVTLLSKCCQCLTWRDGAPDTVHLRVFGAFVSTGAPPVKLPILLSALIPRSVSFLASERLPSHAIYLLLLSAACQATLLTVTVPFIPYSFISTSDFTDTRVQTWHVR